MASSFRCHSQFIAYTALTVICSHTFKHGDLFIKNVESIEFFLDYYALRTPSIHLQEDLLFDIVIDSI